MIKFDTEISHFLSSKSFKQFFFEKKFFQLICADSIFKAEIFQNKWVSRYLTVDNFTIRKSFSSQEIY